MVLRGAGFVTEDVLTLEHTDDGLMAHPGPPVMVVVTDEESRPPRRGAWASSRPDGQDSRFCARG